MIITLIIIMKLIKKITKKKEDFSVAI
jgi:hypothetical protein